MKVALPKGRLQRETTSLLERAGLAMTDYQASSRTYRPRSLAFPNLFFKVFQEKDIPVQVSVGNYDLGICGLDWVEELLLKYPSSPVVKIMDLGYGRYDLLTVTSRNGPISSLDEMKARFSSAQVVRVASEYPHQAESFAFKHRFPGFRVFPVWGAAEAYPPENAELALISRPSDLETDKELISLARIMTSTAFLIANKESFQVKDMSRLLPLFRRVIQDQPHD